MTIKNALLLLLFTNALCAQVSFNPPQIIGDFNASKDIIAADLDGDNDLDIVAISQFNNQITWFANDGSGNFELQADIENNISRGTDIAAFDLDDDNDLDILAIGGSNSDNSRALWIENNGDGTFQPSVLLADDFTSGSAITATDLDLDNDLDIVFSAIDSDFIYWLENLDSDATFGEQQVVGEMEAPRRLVITDINVDGRPDILSTTFGSIGTDRIRVFINQEDGTFLNQGIASWSAVGNDGAGVAAGDLDGDNLPDVVGVSAASDKFTWVKNLLDGGLIQFSNVMTISDDEVNSPTICYLLDLDLDNDLDILYAANFDSTIGWLENDGAGNFSSPETITDVIDLGGLLNSSIEGTRINYADINGDGKVDILAASYDDDQLYWPENTAISPLNIEIINSTTELACFGDMNGAINVNIDGGVAPYLLNWSPEGLEGTELSDLSTGEYSLMVIDSQDDTTNYSFVIESPAEIILTDTTIIHPNILLDNGSIEVVIEGGVSPYNYSWSNGAETAAINNLEGGNYMLTVTDANNCTQVYAFELDFMVNTDDHLLQAQNWKVFPNPIGPASEVLISGPANLAITAYTVYGLDGKEIVHRALSAPSSEIRLSTASEITQTGLFLLKVQTEQGQEVILKIIR